MASFVVFLPMHRPFVPPFWQGWVRSSPIWPRPTAILAALASFARLPYDRSAPTPSDRPEAINASNRILCMQYSAAQRTPWGHSCANYCFADTLRVSALALLLTQRSMQYYLGYDRPTASIIQIAKEPRSLIRRHRAAD